MGASNLAGVYRYSWLDRVIQLVFLGNLYKNRLPLESAQFTDFTYKTLVTL